VLAYNPDEAKKLWAQADAISPWSGTFQIAYNSDGGHQTWVDAVANSIKNTLGIDASGAPYADFASLRKEVTGRTIQTAFRTGWQADYPGLYNFLGPLYATNAGSNDGDYSNPEFDQLLSDGISATDSATANEDFQKAQSILLKDLPRRRCGTRTSPVASPRACRTSSSAGTRCRCTTSSPSNRSS
jgi:oligopeptide transport system substrate-binding protein